MSDASDGQPYSLITDAAGLERVAAVLIDTPRIGLDVETTGLDPRKDKARLLTLALGIAEVHTRHCARWFQPIPSST